MFTNPRYITHGVQAEVSAGLQGFLWFLIETMAGKPDCLQVFHLEPRGGKQHITHIQEGPPYQREYDIDIGRDEKPVTAKLFVIDDADHSTMLLACEY